MSSSLVAEKENRDSSLLELSANNSINMDLHNSKKRALVDPKKLWTLETAVDALVEMVHEPNSPLVNLLKQQAPQVLGDTERLYESNQCSQWSLYQAGMVSLTMQLVNAFGPSVLHETLLPCIEECTADNSSRHELLRELVLPSYEQVLQGDDLALHNLPRALQSVISSSLRHEGRPWKRPWRANGQAARTEWSVPLSYIITHVVASKKGKNWNHVPTTVSKMLSRAFPSLLGNEFQAGIALHGLQALQDQVFAVEGLDPKGVVDLLLSFNVMFLLQAAVGVRRYPLVAKCVEIILQYSYENKDATQAIVAQQEARRLLFEGNLPTSAHAHLDKLQKLAAKATTERSGQKRKSLDSRKKDDEMMLVPYDESNRLKPQLLAPGYPLLVEIELDCCVGRQEQAIGIAERMEQIPGIISEEEQCRAWQLVMEYLRCNSLLFLDGNRRLSNSYLQKRSLLLSLVGAMGNRGRRVLLEYYQRIVQVVTEASDLCTPEEVTYITIAAQQTVLRTMMAKYGAKEGIQYLRETFPSASLWLGDSDELMRWAIGFLNKAPTIPPSLLVDGQADVAALMDRALQEPKEKAIKAAAAPEFGAAAVPAIAAPSPSRNVAVSAKAPSPQKEEAKENEVSVLDDSTEEEDIVYETPSEEEVEQPHEEEPTREDDETAEPQEVTELFEDASEEETKQRAMETVQEEHEYEESEEEVQEAEVVHDVDEEEHVEEVEVVEIEEDEEVEEEEEEQVGDDEKGYEPDTAYGYTEEERVGDEKGYEPDTAAYGFTEEEVSEAVHSEEEEEEEEESEREEVTPLVQHTARVPYSENDMDEADERTASEVEVHDEESFAVGDKTSALMALAVASQTHLEMPPPRAGKRRQRDSDQEDEIEGQEGEGTSEVATTIVNKVPDEDAAFGEDQTSDSVAPVDHTGNVEEMAPNPMEPSPPIVSKVPADTGKDKTPVDDTTNAATAPSDVIAYLSEYTEDASTQDVDMTEAKFPTDQVVGEAIEEIQEKSEDESASLEARRPSMQVQGYESPKEFETLEIADEHSNESGTGEDLDMAANIEQTPDPSKLEQVDEAMIANPLDQDVVQADDDVEERVSKKRGAQVEETPIASHDKKAEVPESAASAVSATEIASAEAPTADEPQMQTDTKEKTTPSAAMDSAPPSLEKQPRADTGGKEKEAKTPLKMDSFEQAKGKYDVNADASEVAASTASPARSTTSATSVRRSKRKISQRLDDDFVFSIIGQSREPSGERTGRSQSHPSEGALDDKKTGSVQKQDGHNETAEESSVETPRNRPSSNRKEEQSSETFGSPAMHTRSHDPPEEGMDKDEELSIATRRSARLRGKKSSESQPVHVFDSPAMHTRSHDPSDVFDSPAMHTRSHDSENATQSSGKSVTVGGKKSTTKSTRSNRKSTAPGAIKPVLAESDSDEDAPSKHTRSHDKSQAKKENVAVDASSKRTRARRKNVDDAPSKRTRSHDENTVQDDSDEDVPSRHTRSHDQRDSLGSMIQGTSIEIPDAGPESPSMSSIVSSTTASSVASRSRRTRPSALPDLDEVLPTVKEESSKKSDESGTTVTRRSTPRREKQSTKSSSSRRKSTKSRPNVADEDKSAHSSGVATRRSSRLKAKTVDTVAADKKEEVSSAATRKSARTRKKTAREKTQSVESEEEQSPPKKRKGATTSEKAENISERSGGPKTRSVASKKAESQPSRRSTRSNASKSSTTGRSTRSSTRRSRK